MKQNSLKLILCLLLLCVPQNWRKCTGVIDGDTIILDGYEKVKLIGVDAPEIKDPRKPIQHFGKEAYEFIKNLVGGKKVKLEYDFNKKDKYGRTLAFVYLEDGAFLNAEIIKQGYGFAYTKYPFKYFEEFKEHEKKARENKVGLWASLENDKIKTREDVIVYITRTGKKYHREHCSSLRISKIPISLKEACKRGYTPCSRCNPPRCK